MNKNIKHLLEYIVNEENIYKREQKQLNSSTK